MSEKTTSLKPPYATYGSFSNFISKLGETNVPSRIDRSVFGNMSGGVAYSILASLKFLKLINEEGAPSNVFQNLAVASEDQRPALMSNIIKSGYTELFTNDVDLSKASAGQFDEWLRTFYGAQGSTLDKAASFFIAAADVADIELSPQIKGRKPQHSSSSSRKSRKQRKSTKGESEAPAVPPKPSVMTEKALEYRLVDLMSEAAGDTEVMKAIISVITFLKTKDAEE